MLRKVMSNVGDVCKDCNSRATGAYEPPGGRLVPICYACAAKRSVQDYGRNATW
jgi:hypothetical protein